MLGAPRDITETDEPPTEHPTRTRLLEATVELLETLQPDQVTSTMVLERSGVAHGSLYHHFEDFGALISEAILVRFGRTTAADHRALADQLAAATDAADYRRRVEALLRATSAQERADRRAERIVALGVLHGRPAAWARLAQVQQALTDDLAGLISTARDRGWSRADVDPVVLATVIQALLLGRVVDDVAERQVDPDVWSATVVRLVASLAFD
jgi:AcrR family transcriptional regulator